MGKSKTKGPVIDTKLDSLVPGIQQGLKTMYNKSVKPVEQAYLFHTYGGNKSQGALVDADFDSRPMVMMLGQYSVGKTSFIKYLLGKEYPGSNIGPEPTTDRFCAVYGGQDERVIPGNAALVMKELPFHGLDGFGNGFLDKFVVSSCKSDLLEHLTIVDTPGVLSGAKQTLARGYSMAEVTTWFAQRCDMIILLFDAHKLDISDEFRQVMRALDGHYLKVKIVLNKADKVTNKQLLRVYASLMWSLGRVISTPEVCRIYLSSFWDKPYENKFNHELFDEERNELLQDLFDMKKFTAIRRTNELVKRVRQVKVHMCMISHLKAQMPSMAGKEKKKKKLMEGLEEEMMKVKGQYNLAVGDFPNAKDFRVWLSAQDFSKFKKFDQAMYTELDEVCSREVPKLLEQFPMETGAQLDQGADAFDDGSWAVTEQDRANFKPIFVKAGPDSEGRVKGGAVKPILSQTSVPQTQLRTLWDLADTDKKGSLSFEEFCVVMYIAENLNANYGGTVPSELPADLIPPSKRVVVQGDEGSNPF